MPAYQRRHGAADNANKPMRAARPPRAGAAWAPFGGKSRHACVPAADCTKPFCGARARQRQSVHAAAPAADCTKPFCGPFPGVKGASMQHPAGPRFCDTVRQDDGMRIPAALPAYGWAEAARADDGRNRALACRGRGGAAGAAEALATAGLSRRSMHGRFHAADHATTTGAPAGPAAAAGLATTTAPYGRCCDRGGSRHATLQPARCARLPCRRPLPMPCRRDASPPSACVAVPRLWPDPCWLSDAGRTTQARIGNGLTASRLSAAELGLQRSGRAPLRA